MLGHTLWHPSSFRVANKTRHLDSCSPINKLSFGLHLAPSPSAPNSRFEHHLKHEIDPAFGRAANIKPDILDGQPSNKLNFSRRPAPSPPAPPKSNVDVITRIRFFVGMRRAADLQHCRGGGGQLLQQKLKLSLLMGWSFFYTIFGRGDVWSWVQHEFERSSWLYGSKLVVHWTR